MSFWAHMCFSRAVFSQGFLFIRYSKKCTFTLRPSIYLVCVCVWNNSLIKIFAPQNIYPYNVMHTWYISLYNPLIYKLLTMTHIWQIICLMYVTGSRIAGLNRAHLQLYFRWKSYSSELYQISYFHQHLRLPVYSYPQKHQCSFLNLPI